MHPHLPRLVSTRKLAALLLAAALTFACAGEPNRRVESQFPVALEGQPTSHVRVSLSRERAAQEHRWTESAKTAVRQHMRMLGALPADPITIVDRPPSARRDGISTARDFVVVTAPLWSTQRGMAVESALTTALARTFWHALVPCDADRAWFVDGLARYTSTVALAAQYDGQRIPAAIGALEGRYFGGFVPWVIGPPVPAWIAPPRSSSDRDRLEIRTSLAMQTLAGWLGSPTAEAVLRRFVAAADGGCASWRELQQTTEDLTGLDFSWLFDQIFDEGRAFDYGVEQVTTDRQPGEPVRYRTRLVVKRYGDGAFTGTSRVRVEPFESGRGVEIAVRFADGSERSQRWDGRAVRRVFEFEGASPPERVTVDPRTVVVVDRDGVGMPRDHHAHRSIERGSRDHVVAEAIDREPRRGAQLGLDPIGDHLLVVTDRGDVDKLRSAGQQIGHAVTPCSRNRTFS